MAAKENFHNINPFNPTGFERELCGRVRSSFGSVSLVKGMVHLIFKLHLKDIFLLMKYNDAISFGQKVCFLTQSVF